MAVLLKDLAKKANTSKTTVSLVLNNKPVRVSKEKREEILRLAEDLNYKPNLTAQSLVTKRTMTIGLIVPDVRNLFFAELVRNIGNILREHNYSLLLCNTNNIEDEDIFQMELLRTKGVDGIFVIFSSTESEKYRNEIDKINREGIPLVIMDRAVKSVSVPFVGVDDKQGGYFATKYLIDCHHKNIACIKGPLYSKSSNNRYKGYCRAMREAGLPICEKFIFQGNFEFESGEVCADEIVKHPEITAVFAENDMMALGLYRGLSTHGKKIGEDISIIGFDDIIFSSMTEIPLTTMNQNVEEISRNAVAILFGIINKEPIQNENVLSVPKLIVRKSVKILD